jgi:hypothetical protein
MGQQYIISINSKKKLEYPSEFIDNEIAGDIGRFIASQQDGIFLYERTLLDKKSVQRFLDRVKEEVWELYKKYQGSS